MYASIYARSYVNGKDNYHQKLFKIPTEQVSKRHLWPNRFHSHLCWQIEHHRPSHAPPISNVSRLLCPPTAAPPSTGRPLGGGLRTRGGGDRVDRAIRLGSEHLRRSIFGEPRLQRSRATLYSEKSLSFLANPVSEGPPGPEEPVLPGEVGFTRNEKDLSDFSCSD